MNNEDKEIEKAIHQALEDMQVIPPSTVWKNVEERIVYSQNHIYRSRIIKLRLTACCLLATLGLATTIIIYQNFHFLKSSPKSVHDIALINRTLTDKRNRYSKELNEKKKSNYIEIPIFKGNKRHKTKEEILRSIIRDETVLNLNLKSFEENNRNKKTNVSKKYDILDKKNTFIASLSIDNKIQSMLEKKRAYSLKKLGPLNPSTMSLIARDLKIEKFPNSKSTSSKKNDAHSTKIFIDVLFSPDYWDRKLKVINNGIYKNLKQDFDENERPSFSCSTGFRLGYRISPRLDVLSGGQFVYITQTILPTSLQVMPNKIDGYNYYLHSSTGTALVEIEGISPKLGDSLQLLSKSTEYISIIQIPASLKYRLTDKKFSLYATGGLSINFFVDEKIKVLLPDAQGLRHATIRNIESMKEIYFSYNCSLGGLYKVNNKYGIFVEPAFRGAINAINKTSPVRVYPYSVGLNLGINYHF